MKSPQEVWRAYIDAWNRHDIDGIMEMVGDEFIYDERPMTMARPLRGRAAFRDYLERTFAMFPDLAIETTSCDAGSTLAVAESVMRGMYSGKIGGGKRIAARVACVFEVKDGTLAHERLYWDRANTLRQLGRTAAVLAVAFQRPVLDPA